MKICTRNTHFGLFIAVLHQYFCSSCISAVVPNPDTPTFCFLLADSVLKHKLCLKRPYNDFLSHFFLLSNLKMIFTWDTNWMHLILVVIYSVVYSEAASSFKKATTWELFVKVIPFLTWDQELIFPIWSGLCQRGVRRPHNTRGYWCGWDVEPLFWPTLDFSVPPKFCPLFHKYLLFSKIEISFLYKKL